jgi:hypothetical protein
MQGHLFFLIRTTTTAIAIDITITGIIIPAAIAPPLPELS